MPIPLNEATRVQAVAELPKEGLPFWTFWLLLSVIVLLLAFIFLRDKDLRLRLSAFLSGAKRRLIRLRLQAKVRREKERLAGLRADLGRRVWSEDVPVDGTADIRSRLQILEEEIAQNQAKWQGVFDRVEALTRDHQAARETAEAALRDAEAARTPLARRLEEIRTQRRELGRERDQSRRDLEAAERQSAAARRDIEDVEARPEAGDATSGGRLAKARERAALALARRAQLQAKLGALEKEAALLDGEEPELLEKVEAIEGPRHETERSLHERTRTFEKKLRRWENARKKIEDRILDLKGRTVPLFEELGRAVDGLREDHPELAAQYAQIDAANQTLSELTDRIHSLQ